MRAAFTVAARLAAAACFPGELASVFAFGSGAAPGEGAGALGSEGFAGVGAGPAPAPPAPLSSVYTSESESPVLPALSVARTAKV